MASASSTLASPSSNDDVVQDLLLTSGASLTTFNGAMGSESLLHQGLIPPPSVDADSAAPTLGSSPSSQGPSVEASRRQASLPVEQHNTHATVEARNTQAPHSVPGPPLIASQAPPSQFVPSLGSWAKPFIFKPPVTPPDPSTPRGYDPALVGKQLAALCPSLNDEILNKQHKGNHSTRSLKVPIEKMPPPQLKADGTLRFPWAARLGPQSRNLFRAASPTYRLDGTPEVSIPSKVLRLGPENKDEYVIGKFHRCSLPPGGLIHAVVNRIWGRNCKIACKKLSDSSYMFHIPHQPTRQWIIQRGVWHINDCLLFVLPWTPEGSFKIPEISTLPVWVNLIDIPDCCYSRLGISHVASGLGEPILTHKPRLDPTNKGEAKVVVEMELDKDFPKLIALDDKQGNIFLVKVEYTWIPSTCERCGCLGHQEKRCLEPLKTPVNSTLTPNSVDISADVPIVDINIIIQQNENAASSTSTFQQKEPSDQERLPIAHMAYKAPIIQNQFNELDGLLVTSKQEKITTAKAAPNSSSGLIPDHEPLVIASDASTEGQVTPASKFKAISSSTQQDNHIALPSLFSSTPILADFQSAPTTTPFMETYPSNNIDKEVHTPFVDPLTTTPNAIAFKSPSCFSVLGDVDETEIEPMSSLGLTRGGRETKPPNKYQDLDWKMVQGKRKHGGVVVVPNASYYLSFHCCFCQFLPK